jgi:putative membrane-bound dehydrogenase-like protein
MNHRFAIALALLSVSIAHGQDRPLPPKEAVKAMTLPKGFNATLFAGEPDVTQPIAMTFDDRGRLWVVECLSYPKWTDKPEGNDRVVMFEDTDGDGVHDRRQVIFDKGANLSGIELGFGGIWLCSIPNLLFIPCDFNADKPTLGEKQVLLDGWSLKCKHNVVNGLIWGPDGWLYGLNGIIDTSKVGKPGTSEKDRTPINCGVWRYHPTKKNFEVVAHGTTNPFGLDFNDVGEMFMTNCVIGHLWHVVPGGHYERMYGQDLVPNTYQLMKTCADHIHWGGGNWTTSRGGKGVHSEAGGGHAHVGCMVYLGDNWPDEYRGDVYMLNLHGSRMNRDSLERQGSGYVAKHKPDFMLANDPWFRGIAVKYGPDGGVYVSDWTDTGECHNYIEVDPSNGRVFKIVHGEPSEVGRRVKDLDLSKLSDLELVKLQTHKNEWFVRHARRLLQERSTIRPRDWAIVTELRKLMDSTDVNVRLRGMWALFSTGSMDSSDLAPAVQGRHELTRSWAVRLAFDLGMPDKNVLALITDLAGKDSLPAVRRAIASALHRIPVDRRFEIAKALVQSITPDDSNLALMIWYAITPIATHNGEQALELLKAANSDLLDQFLTRRILEHDLSEKNLSVVMRVAGPGGEEAIPILKGIQEAIAGTRKLSPPSFWPHAYKAWSKSENPEVRNRAMRLAVVFDDRDALSNLMETVRSSKTSTNVRYDALQALLIQQTPEMQTLLRDLLDDPAMRGSAIRALAAFKSDDTPMSLLAIYPKLNDTEKADVIQTLAARPAWALALLDAIEAKHVPQADVSVFVARQMQGLKDKRVQDRLTKVWGQIKPASKDRAEQIAKFKKLLTADYLKHADLSKGRAVFAKNCAACHKLYDDGGDIGPALTGSQRHNLDYVLENMIDPSAVVPRDYQVTKIETASGRTINGIVKQETDKALTLQTPNELIILPKDEIESRTQSALSIMPEGVLDKLTPDEIRDLVAYLASKDQAPLPKP